MINLIEWITSNWFGIVIVVVFIVVLVMDFIKKYKQTEEEKKREKLENAKRAADVQYVGDGREYVTINAQGTDVSDFVNVYLNMEKEGYVYDSNLNNFQPFDTIIFMRKKK